MMKKIQEKQKGMELNESHQLVTITALNSKHGPSGILIHQQNSYSPRSKRRTGRREAQSRELVNKVSNLPVYVHTSLPECRATL
jgi:hypothetical protein